MSDEFEIRPQESRETGEETERAEAQKLNDATYEPRAYVEQTGDYKQSEAVQAEFTAVVDNTVRMAEQDDQSVLGGTPKTVEGPFEAASGSDDDDGEEVTPINLPNVHDEMSDVLKEPGKLEFPNIKITPDELKLDVSADSGPLPGESDMRVGSKNEGVDPIPLPRPAIERDESIVGGTPKPYSGPMEPASGDGSGDEGSDITPINLPDVRIDGSSKDSAAALEPLPRPAEHEGMKRDDMYEAELKPGVQIDIGGKDVGDMPTPMPRPADGMDAELKSVVQADVGGKEVGSLPIPLPRPERIGEESTSDQANPPREGIPLEQTVADNMVDQLFLQMAMEKKSQFENVFSNWLKTFQQTAQGIVGNLK